MQTFRYLMVLGVGTTVTLGSVPSAFGSTAPERTVQPQLLLQHQQSDNLRHRTPLFLASAPLVTEPTTTRRLGSRSSNHQATGLTINLAQANPPGPQLPPLEPANPSPAPTAPTPSPTTPSPAPTTPTPTAPPTPPAAPTRTPPAAPPPASPEDLNLNRLNPNPNLLEDPQRPDEVRLQPEQAITLQQALELARRNNRDLQVAELTLRRARSGLREAQAALYPRVDSQANFTGSRSEGPAPFGPPGTLGVNSSRTLSGTLQASYDVYTSGRRTATIRAAEQQVRFNVLEVERLTEQLRLDVSNDYYDVQEADANVEISEAAVANAQASVNDAQALAQAGLGTKFDVLQAQVELANSRQDLTNALSQQRTTRRQLANRLSLGPSASVSAAEQPARAADWGRSLPDSIILAFQNRAELLQQRAQRNISEQQRRIALSELGPQLSLVLNYTASEVDGDELGPLNDISAGPRVTLNLFDGGAARARAAQEEANTRIAETNYANTRNQVRFAVEQAYNNLQSSDENIDTSSAAVDQARESLRLARLRFQAGVGIQSDVLDAVAALAEAEGNRIQAILGYNRSLATLQREVSNLQATVPAAAPPAAAPSTGPSIAPTVVP